MIEAQPPVFLMTAEFLKECLALPGGLTDWLSALLMQFWFSDLIISLVPDFLYLVGHGLYQSVDGNSA